MTNSEKNFAEGTTKRSEVMADCISFPQPEQEKELPKTEEKEIQADVEVDASRVRILQDQVS